MKKLLLSLSLITISLFGMDATELPISHQILTKILESRQTTFMGKDEFNAFINQYVSEATEKLSIFKYFTENPGKWDDQIAANNEDNYLQSLISYTNAYNKTLIYPVDSFSFAFEGNHIEFNKREVQNSIMKIDLETKLSLDTQKEFNDTIGLLEKINKEYYEQLQGTSKIKFNLHKAGIWIVDRTVLSGIILLNGLSNLIQ